MKKIQLTKEGYETLQKEYRELKEHKRPAAVERLQKARAMGDLSENSEYTAAKEDLALVEGRVQELEEILRDVEIIDQQIGDRVVKIGKSVTVEREGERATYMIVGEFEADPMNKKLSHTSPIGKALLGRKVDEVVKINTPAGKTTYSIVDIK
ncbi:transcription elongation factor GreA [Candidatus Roizmanbacteria bacterium]|nr:transcription elongation factor GreA [Candidatus Roizmanbacteria bacterium]